MEAVKEIEKELDSVEKRMNSALKIEAAERLGAALNMNAAHTKEASAECEAYKPAEHGDVYKDTLINLVYTHTWMNTNLKLHFDPHNITVQQYNILRILRAEGDKPATINLLKDKMMDKMSDASRIVERLVQKELVVRKVCCFDRRAVDISITQAGLNLLLVVDKDIVAREIIGDSLTEDELRQLNTLLAKLRKEA